MNVFGPRGPSSDDEDVEPTGPTGPRERVDPVVINCTMDVKDGNFIPDFVTRGLRNTFLDKFSGDNNHLKG